MIVWQKSHQSFLDIAADVESFPKKRAPWILADQILRSTGSIIVNNLHELAANPDSPTLNIDVLKGRKGFRLRVGQYRVIYTRQDDRLVIEVVKIRPRGDIYKR